MNKELEKWLKLVKENEAHCYIKKNRYKHDSGFGCFEVGYIIIENAKMKDKLIIGEYTDHIWFNHLFKKEDLHTLNLDVTTDGYIRFFSHINIIKWDCEFGLSTMGFETLTKTK
jgi:hypothetical protein